MARGFRSCIVWRPGSIGVLAAAVGLTCFADTPAVVSRDVASMGTRLRLTISAADRPRALAASESALRAIEAAERRLSTWRSASELHVFNQRPPGTWFLLSSELARDLETAASWWRRTEGAFDPGIASLVSAWDLRGGGRIPTEVELERALRSAGYGFLELAGGRARKATAGFGIEEGGFGKGVALRDAAEAALAGGAVCVELDFGGHFHLEGRCGRRAVSIADPRRRDRVVAEFPLTAGSVATSSAAERFVEVGGEVLGHILDPRTGRPVPAWGSVTVIADDPVAADCLATALFVMGKERGLEWAARRSDFTAVFVVIEGSEIRVFSTADDGRAGWDETEIQQEEADGR